MKTNPWLSLLIAALFINAAATAVLSFQYVRTTGALIRLQAQRAVANRQMVIFQSLVNDTVEFSKRNPAVIPALRTLDITVTKSAPTKALKTPVK